LLIHINYIQGLRHSSACSGIVWPEKYLRFTDFSASSRFIIPGRFSYSLSCVILSICSSYCLTSHALRHTPPCSGATYSSGRLFFGLSTPLLRGL